MEQMASAPCSDAYVVQGSFRYVPNAPFYMQMRPTVSVTLSYKMKQCHNYEGLGIDGIKWVIWV